MRFSRLLLLSLIILALLQVAYYGPRLPDRMATHFDGAGAADGWSSRTEFTVMSLAMALGMGLIFLGTTAWLDRIPNAWINLPHKEYWLAPERRTATLDAFAREMEWLGAATLVLLLGITQLTIEANLTGSGSLGNGFWLLFGSYMLYVVIWVVLLLRRTYAPVPRHDV